MGSFLVGEYLEVSLEKIQKEYDYDTHYEVLPELIVLSSYYLFLNSSKSNIDFARKIQGDGLRFFTKLMIACSNLGLYLLLILLINLHLLKMEFNGYFLMLKICWSIIY